MAEHNPITICGMDVIKGVVEPIVEYDNSISILPYRIKHAYDVIKSLYDDDVLVRPLDIFKFGRTLNADNGVKTTVQEFQDDTVVNETYATDNTIDQVVSSSASDTQIIDILGFTLSGSDLTTVSQKVTLNGQTPVNLTTPLARCTRIFNDNSISLVGNVYVFDSTEASGVTSGVPNTASATKCMISTGENQSQKASTSIPSTDYFLITGVSVNILKGTSGASADIYIEARAMDKIFRPITNIYTVRANANPNAAINFDPVLIVPKNYDVRIVATSNSNNTQITAGMTGYLASIRT